MIEACAIVQFGNESFVKQFVCIAATKLVRVAFFEKQTCNQNIVFCEDFRKLFTAWEIKRFGYPAFKKKLFQLFDIVVKIRRDAFRLMESTSDEFLHIQWGFQISNSQVVYPVSCISQVKEVQRKWSRFYPTVKRMLGWQLFGLSFFLLENNHQHTGRMVD